MFRKTMTTLSLLGLLLSVGVWGAATAFTTVTFVPASLKYNLMVREAGFVVTIPDQPVAAVPAKYADMMKRAGNYSVIDANSPAKTYARPGFSFRRPSKGLRFGSLPFIWKPASPKVTSFIISHWCLASMFGLVFLACKPWTYYRHRKRERLGLCLNCGYDLRASKDRCPECGTEFESSGVQGLRRVRGAPMSATRILPV
ncbi:MAG: hypothetical protein IID34_12695 [Planctomycetes bacterium]|nr:hypothetical protein [Planctomycetota bacterium]